MSGLGATLATAFESAAPVFAEALLKAQGKTPGPNGEENVARLGSSFADSQQQALGALLKGMSKPVFDSPREDPMSVVNDPYLWQQGNPEFGNRPSSLSWGTLKRMARSPLLSTIIQIRCEQLATFCRPQTNPHLPGFRVKLRGAKRAPRRGEANMSELLEKFLVQCGTVQDVRQLQIRPTFPAFAKLYTRDALTYDQACAEIVPSRASRLGGAHTPARFVAVDASTIRIAQAALDAHGLPEDDYRTARHVQVLEDSVVNEYPLGRMMMWVRNPSTSVYTMGYGMAESEMLIRVITAWLNAFARNHQYFTQGFNADGILNIKKGEGTGISETHLRAFKREIQLMAMGVQNAHRLPIAQSPGMEWVKVGNDAQEMQWPGWSDLLVKLAYAIFLMDPAEGNFTFGNTGQAAAMAGSSEAEKIEESKQRGLVPLVQGFYDVINRYIIWPLDPDFEVEATGIKRRDEASELDLDTKRLKSFWTINEVRALRDMPPLPGKQGEIIMDPSFLQGVQMAAAEDDDQPDPEPIDMGGLFEPQDDEQDGTAGADAGQDQPDVIPDEQPLAASARSQRRTTISL